MFNFFKYKKTRFWPGESVPASLAAPQQLLFHPQIQLLWLEAGHIKRPGVKPQMTDTHVEDDVLAALLLVT